VATLGMLTTARAAHAQRAMHIQPELRADGIFARTSEAQLAAGVSVALGRYVRVELAAGGGSAFAQGRSVASGRLDAVARFLLDPDFTQRIGLYAGGGLGLRVARELAPREVLIVVLGAEGPAYRMLVPFVEAGYGGGARVGAGVRWRWAGR
jgi:hypothetical protein